MKKVLSTVAALGLVAGLASTAAAVEFKMSGNYLVEGAYLSNAGNANGVDPSVDMNTSDSYYLHTFEMKPTMKVNDKVSMNATIRLADDTFWGSQTDGSTATDKDTGNATGDVEVWHLYMDYASPIGNTRFGRVPAGTYGTAFRDYDSRADRIAWWPNFVEKPWTLLFYIDKAKDNDVTANAQTAYDSDKYVARVYYKNDTMDLGLHYGYYSDLTNDSPDAAPTPDVYAYADHKHEVSAYGKFKMDNYFMNAELTHFFGDRDYDQSANAAAGTSAVLDRDFDSWAGMLQVGGKFDALTPSLMYFYASGQDVNETAANGGDMENALGTTGTGDLFEPLYILTGRHTGMLNNDLFDGYTSEMSSAGVHAVVLAADYTVSKDLTLHGAIGWAQADEEEITGQANQDDEYGWEYNVGAAYKLLDNLTYEAHFGYLDTGDYFEYGVNAADTENIYLMTHSLSMTF
ncbi:MAG: hypothetical protein WCZ86_10705 [Desulfurivibrionaceae bacterium]